MNKMLFSFAYVFYACIFISFSHQSKNQHGSEVSRKMSRKCNKIVRQGLYLNIFHCNYECFLFMLVLLQETNDTLYIFHTVIRLSTSSYKKKKQNSLSYLTHDTHFLSKQTNFIFFFTLFSHNRWTLPSYYYYFYKDTANAVVCPSDYLLVPLYK